jgi:hypothetical protein
VPVIVGDAIFWSENVKGRDHSEDLGVDGKNIRLDLRGIGWEGVDGMHLAQEREQWRALVDTAMNLRFP